MSRFPLLTFPELYASVRPSHDGTERLSGFYSFILNTWVDTKTTTVVRVHVREHKEGDPESTTWGKLDSRGIGLIQPSWTLFSIQFPYRVKEGDKGVMRVHVEELERFLPSITTS